MIDTDASDYPCVPDCLRDCPYVFPGDCDAVQSYLSQFREEYCV